MNRTKNHFTAMQGGKLNLQQALSSKYAKTILRWLGSVS